MRFCILGSGSSGNSTLVVAGETRVLIDCGLSGRETIKRLQAIGEDPARINAIVVTHEHGDHARSLSILSKTLNVPIYISTAALEGCKLGERTKNIRRGEVITSSQEFEIGAFRFRAFSVPHDCADPLGLTIEAEGAKLGLAVDLGYISPLTAENFRGSDAIIIEADHDIEMLRACIYPWSVKQRIMSRTGHTSNDEVGRFLREDFDNKAAHVVLAHLSINANHPALAKLVAVQALQERFPLLSADAERRVKIAPRTEPGEWIEL